MVLPSHIQPAGSYRPFRQFFALLEPLDTFRRAPHHAAGCPVKTFKFPSSFPVELRLVRARGGDLGNTGLWSQHEFAKHLAFLSGGRADVWKIEEIEYVQQSFARHTAIRIVEPSSKVPKAAPAGAKKAGAENFDLFDCPLLSTSKGPMKPEQKVDPEDWDQLSDLSDFLDGGASELEEEAGPAKGQKRKSEKEELPGSPSKGIAPEKAVSEAASARSGFQVKTIATEMDVVEAALREVGRQVHP